MKSMPGNLLRMAGPLGPDRASVTSVTSAGFGHLHGNKIINNKATCRLG